MKVSGKWRGNARRLERIGLGISGKFFPVIPILPPETEIGYTSEGKTIHLLAYPHPIVRDLDETHQTIFVSGVYAHELMHQLETDFQSWNQARQTAAIPKLFDIVMNVIEDPAIEYWAPHYFGGPLLKSLRYSVMHMYRDTDDFAVAEIDGVKKTLDPLAQFINACVQYGDGGLLKGKFASKEAEEAFRKALPIIDQAIMEPSGKKRIDLGMEVYRIVESFVDVEAYQKAEKMLSELLKELGKCIEPIPSGGSTGTPIGDESKEPIPADKTDAQKLQRRKTTARQLGAGQKGKGQNSSGENKDEKSGNAAGPQKAEDAKEGDNANAQKPGDMSPGKEKGGEGLNSSINTENGIPGADPSDDCSGSGVDPDSESVIDYDTYELAPEDIETIEKSIGKALEEETREQKTESTYSAERFPDFASVNAEYSGVRVLNRQIACDDMEKLLTMYNQVVEPINGSIAHLASQLRRIIQNDREERDYRCSGRLNVNRYSGSRVTARVFDKHVEPRNVSDMAVLILVDCSGSMAARNKCEKARQTTIGLAEALSRVKIPFKVIGFRADQMGYHAIHEHFVNFHDSVAERAKLLNLFPRGNNFDGYAIRYGSELLHQRPEEHKLMFVISDGQPACCFYNGARPGVADTMRAVRYAQKKVHVIGLAIDANTEILHTIYKNDFVVVKQADSLLNIIGKKIQKEMKR